MAAGTLGSLVLEIGTNIAKLRGDMEQSVSTVREAMEKIGGQIDFVETAFKRLGEAATIGGVIEITRRSLEAADAIGKISIKTGLAADEYQKLAVAAQLADVDTQSLATGLKLLDKNIAAAAGGAKQQSAIFQAFGIDLKQIGTGADASRKVLDKFADGIASLKDAPWLQVAASVSLLGRAGNQLLPALQGGGAELEHFRKLADDLGVVLSDNTIKAAASFNDSLKVMKLVIEGQGNKILTELAGPLATVAKVFEDTAVEAAKLSNADDDLTTNQLVNWGDAAARAIAFLADAFDDARRIIGIVGLALGETYTAIVNNSRIVDTYFQKLKGQITPEEATKAIKSYEEEIQVARKATELAIDDLTNHKTFGQALEEALSGKGKTADTESSVKRMTDDARARLEKALAQGTGGTDIAKQQKEYLDNLQKQIAGDQEMTKEAEVLYDIEKGRAALFDETTKKKALADAIQIDTIKGTADAERFLAEQTKNRAEMEAKANQALVTQAQQVRDAIRTPAEIYGDSVRRLNELLDAGVLSQEDWTRALTHAQEELAATTQQGKNLESAAKQLGLTFTSAFEDAIAGGKSLSDVLTGLLQDIAKIITRLTITEPLGQALTNWLSPKPTTGKKADTTAGSGIDLSGFGGAVSGAWDWFKGLFGFQYGGSFVVGGSGGPDSQLVAFKATPGEQVTVGNGGGTSINFTIQANDAAGFDSLLLKRRGMITAMIQSAFDKNAKRGMRR